MSDVKTLAYINAFAIFGAFKEVCELDSKAKELASPEKPVSVRFNVTNGPQAVFKFENGVVTTTAGAGPANIHLKLFSPEGLNKMVDGTGTPIPLKGLLKLGFVLKNFTELGAIAETYLRATPEKLLDRDFFEKSTKIMASVIAGAICQIGNHDPIGSVAASRLPNGDLAFEIGDDVAHTIRCNNGKLEHLHEKCLNPRAVMKFNDLDTARGMFDGKVDAMECLGEGSLVLKGYFPILMGINNMLGIVAEYLA